MQSYAYHMIAYDCIMMLRLQGDYLFRVGYMNKTKGINEWNPNLSLMIFFDRKASDSRGKRFILIECTSLSKSRVTSHFWSHKVNVGKQWSPHLLISAKNLWINAFILPFFKHRVFLLKNWFLYHYQWLLGLQLCPADVTAVSVNLNSHHGFLIPSEPFPGPQSRTWKVHLRQECSFPRLACKQTSHLVS